MSFSASRCLSSRNVHAAVVGAFAVALLTVPATAHAQANLRIAMEAKLQLFTPAGINVTANAGNYPVTYQEFTGGGYLSSGSGYTNNVSGGGITTGVVTELFTGSGPDPSSAIYNLLFNPSVTLTNTTGSMLQYSFVYDISYGAFVNAMPNGGSASASENVSIFLNNSASGPVSNFQHGLSTTNGFQSSDPGIVPGQLSGNGVIFPGQSATFAFITRVEGSVQYTPPVAIPVPEPGSLVCLSPALLLGAVVVRRYRKAMC